MPGMNPNNSKMVSQEGEPSRSGLGKSGLSYTIPAIASDSGLLWVAQTQASPHPMFYEILNALYCLYSLCAHIRQIVNWADDTAALQALSAK
jgi:hypothetical protein